MQAFALYLAAGAGAGLLAGLLGVGGGLVIVPILVFIFTANGFPPEHVLHLALGTSLATIIITSISSARAHHAHGAVNWDVLRRIAPGVAAGCLAGAWLAGQLDARPLKILFVVFEFYVGTQILLQIAPHPARKLPGNIGMTAMGVVIGLVSSLVGIGGGTLSVPFLVICNRGMREAVGTSSAIGLPIAVFGSIGYILSGLHVPDLPGHSIGFVHLQALAGIALASAFTAPLGAKAAHRLPVPLLKKLFALLLYALGAKMAFSLF
jgi:uncharacterized membrane protein YfcA